MGGSGDAAAVLNAALRLAVNANGVSLWDIDGPDVARAAALIRRGFR